MATTSTVSTFNSALKTAIDAQTSTQVDYGWPGDVIEKECIWITETRGTFEIPTLKAGRKSRDEEYEVMVTIDVLKVGGTPAQAEAAAFTHLATIEDILADDPAGVGGVTAAVAGDFYSRIGREDQGSYCRLEFRIRVWARLN